MRFSFFIAIAGLITSTIASPTSHHVLHEKRDSLPQDWVKRGKLDGRAVIPIRIALAQRNLDRGYESLLEVSDPLSSKFSQHWTVDDVVKMFAPSTETVGAVRDWLKESGIAPARVKQTSNLSWLAFNATVDETESLLKAKYNVYQHRDGPTHIACESYSVPEHIRPHLDFITPTVHFDVPVKDPSENDRKKRDVPKSIKGTDVQPGIANSVGSPNNGFLPKLGRQINIKGIIDQLEDCDQFIVPNCLRALYRFPPGISANPRNSYGIVEYTPQAYLQSDLDLFFQNFSSRLVGQSPILASIDGGIPQTTMKGFEYNGESDLDLQYAMTLVYPLNVTLYQVGDTEQSGSFNTFLDAIDGSYCTFEGGDDPTQDPSYPDPNPGGYTGELNCGGFPPTNVISTSYGYNEADLTPFYEQRQCNEYMKLGLMGVTILYSSGDYGVAGNGGQCIDPTTGQYNQGGSGLFNPSFPGSCPYVTSVGATQVNPGASVLDPESACQQVIFSGGGFSNVFPLPSYQAEAVKNFYANYPPPYGADRYNNSQNVRGFPDISANGANYVVAVTGTFSLIYGTSASAPTVGAIVTLLNEARLAVNKKPIGFLNPTLYANPDALNDITSGGNQGCGTPGFTSEGSGWDPVTGLGTPNFPKLLKLFLSLP
ncbi:MAG: hypothetical protein M1837_004884 [Sclerophora amabilis]|nr:MAG: hypothetical protein M1837_004884 [Sclerophora amabilis]